MKPHKDPEGYKKLLVYKKSDELHTEALKLAEEIKMVERGLRGEVGERAVNKILLELADQIGRASRSPKSNIVEGWKRNSTKEYYNFLGFSIASTDEIKEDCEDIVKGRYKELIPMLRSGQVGVKGIMGDMGTEGMGLRGGKGETGSSNSLDPLTPLHPLSLDQLQKFPFYPLNPFHPLVVQIYLRCKELTMLLNKLQQSLQEKMKKEGTMTARDKLNLRLQQDAEAELWLKQEIERIKREKREEGE